MRFRKNFPVPLPLGRPIRVDVVFPKQRVAVFLDGCFWHSCPTHGTLPVTNQSYWVPKLARNKERDRDDTRRLVQAGWTVVRAWEHESVESVVERTAVALK
jgi:DNA mismatch endonuclease (patch repair protein)